MDTDKQDAALIKERKGKFLGFIPKGCHCLEHQEIYNNWPTHKAELTIAQCMRICVHCGKFCGRRRNTQTHEKIPLRSTKCETCRNARKRQLQDSSLDHQGPTNIGVSARPSDARIMRNQSLTNSTVLWLRTSCLADC